MSVPSTFFRSNIKTFANSTNWNFDPNHNHNQQRGVSNDFTHFSESTNICSIQEISRIRPYLDSLVVQCYISGIRGTLGIQMKERLVGRGSGLQSLWKVRFIQDLEEVCLGLEPLSCCASPSIRALGCSGISKSAAAPCSPPLIWIKLMLKLISLGFISDKSCKAVKTMRRLLLRRKHARTRTLIM